MPLTPPPPQAACLHPFLIAKAKGWATASRGYFQCVRHAVYAQAEEGLQGRDGWADDVAWARIKSPERAVEKAVRLYREVCLGLRLCAFRRS